MLLSQHVESYRFWEVVIQWAQERLQHEHVVARALAKAVVRDGLRVQSVDARWLTPGTFELRGAPLVGYVAGEGMLPVFIRATALTHLRSIVERAATPQPEALFEEFMAKQDFHVWLTRCGFVLPAFWFGAEARRGG
ncbi:hypothetical protein HK414_18980 [Ramlibacter terrae]|uniref:Uncharacterized protein n=1 Tax=Ramlibacter terrae TaxID=2732511 RepID=A0ABX6P4E3_9BURK|nr:hypothetical protein HK414_18980 [Ramlibacter terrae]